MRSVILMYSPMRALFFAAMLLSGLTAVSQVNSPFSRFGIGDIYDSRNVINKGMGGLATPFADFQSVNFINPASYSNIAYVTFDVGIETEVRTLFNRDKTESFQSANMIFNYGTMGMPLLKNKKNLPVWGLAFGIRPVSRVRFNVQSFGTVIGDSATTEFTGNGGMYRGFVGTGFKLGGLSLGVNVGYMFGQQDLNTYRSINNDSVFHYVANVNNKTSITKFMADAGMQYDLKLGKKKLIRLGANGSLGGDARARRDVVVQTSFFNSVGGADSIDVVSRSREFGEYTLPASYTVGIMYENPYKVLFGVEYEQTQWADFRNFGRPDQLGNSEMLRVGGQFIPDATSRQYFKNIAFRSGFFTGKDYIIAGGEQLPVWGITVGGGFPIKKYNAYSTQSSTINASLEFGRRGSNETLYNERYFKINIGLALSDMWFIKRQFD